MACSSFQCLSLQSREIIVPQMKLIIACALTLVSKALLVMTGGQIAFFQLILVWFGMGSDLGLIILSYTLILRSVLRLNSAEAVSQALRTCSSHLIHILFFYTVVVISVAHLAETTATLMPLLLNVICKIIPPSLLCMHLRPENSGKASERYFVGLTKEIKIQKK